MSLIFSSTRLGRSGAALVAAAAVALTTPGHAAAHSAFLGATPAAGQRVEAPPSQLRLRFTERLNRGLTRAEIVPSRGGDAVAATVSFQPPGELVLTPVRSLETGAYLIRWRAVSTEDGHRLEGVYSIGVRAPAASAGGSIQTSPLESGAWVRIPFRALLYVSLLLFAATLLLRVLLPDRQARPWPVPAAAHGPAAVKAAGRLRSLTGDLGPFALGSATAAAAVDAMVAAGTATPRALRDYLLTGPAGIARLATVGLLALAAWQAARRPRVAATLASLAVGTVALSGHAGSADPEIPAIVNDWAHLLAGAVWLGGVALILHAWRGDLRDAALRRMLVADVLPRFGKVALPAVAIVVVSGLTAAVIQLGDPQALWQTGYGRLLAAKIALVGTIAGLSFLHAIRLRPRLLAAESPDAKLERRHWRLLRAERPLALAVIAVAAVLVAFPLPPGQLEAAAVAGKAGVCDPCPLPAPKPGELAVAAQAGRGVVAVWLRRGERLEGELRQFALSGKPASNLIRVPSGALLAACGPGCHRFGAPLDDSLVVERFDRGRWHRVLLPARWSPGGAAAARRLLERTQAKMRALAGVREDERVTSGPGTLAVTSYLLQAPNRLEALTGSGVRRIQIGAKGWLKVGDEPWRRSPPAVPFRLRTWFRWTPFAQSIELLGRRRDRGRELVEIAFFDPATPSWHRLLVDPHRDLAVRGQTLVRAHLISQSYRGYGRRSRIDAPTGP